MQQSETPETPQFQPTLLQTPAEIQTETSSAAAITHASLQIPEFLQTRGRGRSIYGGRRREWVNNFPKKPQQPEQPEQPNPQPTTSKLTTIKEDPPKEN